jgi:hypothetical protein
MPIKKAPSKICYSYLATTGEYMGQAVAYLDPIEQVHNLPAQAVWENPETLGDWGEQWPFWTGSAWELRTVDVPQ